MNRDKQEMALWRRVFEHWYRRELYEIDTCGNVADAAVAEFRKRYPAEPTAPEPTEPGLTWYDEPPFPKDGRHHACWVTGESHVQSVYWFTPGGWRYCQPYVKGPYPLHDRRVCPIAKPPEPTT